MSYQILRTAKLTTFGNIGGSGAHNFRERETFNALAELTTLNINEGCNSTAELIDKVKCRLDTVKKVRKNAVLAIEYLITFSHQFSIDNPQKTQDAYFDDAISFLKAKHGSENVVCTTIHRDELTPHLVVYVVPIDSNGDLNCKSFLGGRTKLGVLQSDFHCSVSEKYGLKRGVIGSTAKHKAIQDWYGEAINSPEVILTTVPEVPSATFSERMLEAGGIETAHSIALKAAKSAEEQLSIDIKKRNEKNAAKARAFDADSGNRKRLNDEVARVRAENTELRNRLRDIPLKSVIEAFGGVQSKKDKDNYDVDGVGRIQIKGSQFRNHTLKFGRGGAIDLVMHLHNCDMQTAVATLSKEFGVDATASAVASRSVTVVNGVVTDSNIKPASMLPDDQPHNWSAVKKWLMESRNIPANILDFLRDKKLIRADDRGNAIFVNQTTTGGEIRGKGADFKGYRGKRGLFVIDRSSDKTLFVVESGTDAMAVLALNPKRYGKIVSTGGDFGKVTITELKAFKDAGYTIFVGTDNDKSGDDKWLKLSTELELTYRESRILPVGRDWQEDLAEQVKLGFGRAGFKPAPDGDYSRPVF